ncbi:MAG TPA: ATP-binding cassette domain-containing protein [Polyangiaceae bacterium]
MTSAAQRPFAPDEHIVVEDLSKRFGSFEVLRDLNLSMRRGHVAVVIGGSGAGKSTLLKMLIGLDKPTRGAVYINGQNIVPLGERKMNQVRQKFGMVFQYSALLDSMTVLDNIAFPLREHTKLREREIRERVREKLGILELTGTEARFPSELSGGMRKRVALARALMLDPEVIMYDEPTSGLDPITARLVDRLIVDTRDRFGVTSVVISHDMAGALRIADEIYLLARGVIVASGTPNELVHGKNELVQEFFESSGIAAEDLIQDHPSAVQFRSDA